MHSLVVRSFVLGLTVLLIVAVVIFALVVTPPV